MDFKTAIARKRFDIRENLQTKSIGKPGSGFHNQSLTLTWYVPLRPFTDHVTFKNLLSEIAGKGFELRE